MGKWAITALALAAATCSVRADAIERFEGYARALTGDSLIYRESHWLDGATRTVLYRCPDGKPFARKVVQAGHRAAAPDFVSDDDRDGHREGVRGAGDGFEVFVREGRTATERSKRIDKPESAVIDAGFDAFVREHWDDLAIGNKLPLKFLIPSRLSYADFAISRLADDAIDGVAVRRYRLELGAWYAFALPRIDVAYTVDRQQLRRYEGLGNIRSNKGSNLSVRIDFPPAEQGRGAADGLADPATVALDGRCPL